MTLWQWKEEQKTSNMILPAGGINLALLRVRWYMFFNDFVVLWFLSLISVMKQTFVHNNETSEKILFACIKRIQLDRWPIASVAFLLKNQTFQGPPSWNLWKSEFFCQNCVCSFIRDSQYLFFSDNIYTVIFHHHVMSKINVFGSCSWRDPRYKIIFHIVPVTFQFIYPALDCWI